MKVAILILNWNSIRADYAQDLVESLNKTEYPQDKFRIFVHDNASDDGSAEYIEQNLKNATIFRNTENTGFAPPNNKMTEMAIAEGYDAVYLLNHDTEVRPNFLTEAVKLMEADPKVGSVQSRLMLHQDKDKINSMGNLIHFLGFGFSAGGYEPIVNYPREKWNGRPISNGSGAATLYRLEVIKKTGLFDPDFFAYHEDLDLGWTIQIAGFKNVLAYDSVVYHKYEFSKSIQKYYYMERNRYIVLLENYKLGTLLLILLPGLCFDLGVFLFSIRSGFWRQKLRAYAYFFNPTVIKKIWLKRQAKFALRKVKDREILKTFTGEISNQHINNPLLLKIVNPLYNTYFKLLKLIIFW